MGLAFKRNVKAGNDNHLDSMKMALGTPTLEGLAYALRHPETWPKGFHWDYRDTCHCGIGLVHELWDEKVPPDRAQSIEPYLSNACRLLALPYTVADDMFVGSEGYGNIECRKVKPEMIADKIDAYLKSKDESR